MRPANLMTALADVLAGLAIVGLGIPFDSEGFLLISTVCLYAGGVVLNDVFDAELDAVERPERAIPSGKVPKKNATLLGIFLLVGGIAAGFLYSLPAGILSVIISALVILYDGVAKKHGFFGPLVMGLCRGANLLLGMAANLEAMADWWVLASVPVIYIFAVTLISRGEVHGGDKKVLLGAAILFLVVHATQFYVALGLNTLRMATPLILLHMLFLSRPLVKAIRVPSGMHIGKAVKAGVISLIIMDAAWCAVFFQAPLAVVALLLYPISIGLARLFAVT